MPDGRRGAPRRTLALLDLAIVAEPVAGGLRSARGVSRSISAEHGLGQSRAGIIGDHKDAYELQLMRGVKELFDPAGLMNPGRVVPNARGHRVAGGPGR